MPNTDRFSLLERWANGAEAFRDAMETKYGPAPTPPQLPPYTTYDAMLEAIVDNTVGAKRLLNKKSPTYHSDNAGYTKVVPAGDVHYASLEQIGGKTLVWNQLLREVSSTYWYNYSNSYTSATYSDGVAEVTILNTGGSNYIRGILLNSSYRYTAIGGHKYFISADTKTNQASVTFMGEYTQGAVQALGTVANANTWTHLSQIFTCETTIIKSFLTYPTTNLEGLVYSIKNTMIFDLTLMYGSGNEPSTVAEFEAMFPAQYYPYNAGQLLSAGVTEVVSQGRNLYDNANAVIRSGFLSSSGLPTGQTRFASSSVARCLVFEVKPNTQYTVARKISVGGRVVFGCFDHIPADQEIGYSPTYDPSQTVDGYAYTTITTTQTAKYLLWYYFNSNDGGSTEAQIREPAMLTYGNTVYPYSPYTKTPYPIPAEIQALEGYGWSARSVYNYVDFERKVFVKNVGSVDLGTLTWGYGPSVGWSATLPNVKNPADDDTAFNGLSATLKATDRNTQATAFSGGTDAGMVSVAGGKVYVGTGDIGIVPSGTLYYELDEPVETDISEYLTDDNLIEVESGGTLTFPNANGDDYRIEVPSAETFIVGEP